MQTSYDPAEGWALVFAITLLIGLMTSLTIKRRRVWYRISGGTDGENASMQQDPADDGGRTVVGDRAGDGTVRVEIGGLARTDQAGYGDEFHKLVALVDGA